MCVYVISLLLRIAALEWRAQLSGEVTGRPAALEVKLKLPPQRHDRDAENASWVAACLQEADTVCLTIPALKHANTHTQRAACFVMAWNKTIRRTASPHWLSCWSCARSSDSGCPLRSDCGSVRCPSSCLSPSCTWAAGEWSKWLRACRSKHVCSI